MTIDPKPVRSLLFVPANREDRMRKSLTIGADAVVFDLESAIPRGEAEPARAMVRRVIDGHDSGSGPSGPAERGKRPAVFVRVSEVDSADFGADLDTAVRPGLDGILLPQVRSVDDVLVAARALDKRDPDGRVILVPLIETANAVRTAFEIASASPRIAYLGGGVSRDGDIARSIGYRWSPEGMETLYLRSKVLIDVRAAGVVNPITGIWGIVDDLDGLAAFARQARDLGYEGLMCIHPTHVPIIHEIFTPSVEDIAHWRSVVDAMAEAQAQGLGAIRLDGRLIDVAHLHTARQNLARAQRLGVI
ncbi:MAG TPA: CoA ester lyase [Acidimicrobiales bacterium]|jgi:citrate lyase subunit beta/citryl-CoA lyase|nr:CoA ester lyase [Acidimicrobiales bacterium]